MMALMTSAVEASMGRKTKPAGSTPAGFARFTSCASVLRVLEGRPDRSGLVRTGIEYRDHAGLLPLIDAIALDAAELHHHHAGLGPLAVLGESDLADESVEGMRVHVLRELGVVETVGRRDRLIEHLHHRVSVRRQIIAERVDALFHRDRKSTRLNSSHLGISYAVFCLK